MTDTQTVPDDVLRDAHTRKRLRLIAFAIGAAVYITSFFLPAVGIPREPVSGWICAEVALAAPLQTSGNGFFTWILFTCGLINPMALAYSVLLVSDAFGAFRRGIGIAALSFIPLSWICIFRGTSPMTVAIGHVAWIAGLLLMMGPEAVLGPVDGAARNDSEGWK
jgi:hypothetical protein